MGGKLLAFWMCHDCLDQFHGSVSGHLTRLRGYIRDTESFAKFVGPRNFRTSSTEITICTQGFWRVLMMQAKGEGQHASDADKRSRQRPRALQRETQSTMSSSFAGLSKSINLSREGGEGSADGS